MFSLLRDDEKGCTVGFVGIGKSNLALMRLVPRDCGVVLRSDKKADLSSCRGVNAMQRRLTGTAKARSLLISFSIPSSRI